MGGRALPGLVGWVVGGLLAVVVVIAVAVAVGRDDHAARARAGIAPPAPSLVGPESKQSGPGSAALSQPAPVPGAARLSPDSGPIEPDPADEAGGSGGNTTRDLRSAQGRVYTWHDGDRVLRVRVQTDLAVRAGEPIGSADRIVRRSELRADIAAKAHPVFRATPQGPLMTLPGGVLVVLDAAWSQRQVDEFFSANRVKARRVSDLDWLANGFFVETGEGFESLDLANALAEQEGVEVSTPNWWTEAVTR